MTMLRVMGVLVVVLSLCVSRGFAGTPSASWEGLVGLYTLPTAETLPDGRMAGTFSEIRFPQENGDRQLLEKWFTGSLTYAMDERWEFGLTMRHDVVTFTRNNGTESELELDETFLLGHVKYIITPVEQNKVGIAVGVQDVAGSGGELNGVDLNRGPRIFLVGSYRWAHLGVTHDDSGMGASAGARISLSDNIDLITEWSTRPIFAQLDPRPSNPLNFNLGLRLYPREIPGLRADIVAVGDGAFNLGFSFSYLFTP